MPSALTVVTLCLMTAGVEAIASKVCEWTDQTDVQIHLILTSGNLTLP